MTKTVQHKTPRKPYHFFYYRIQYFHVILQLDKQGYLSRSILLFNNGLELIKYKNILYETFFSSN